jgi:hypothetical protein
MLGGADIRRYFVEPTEFTHLGARVSAFGSLTADIAELVRTVQGLIVYDNVAGDFYGIEVSEQRAMEIHLRRVNQVTTGKALPVSLLQTYIPKSSTRVGSCPPISENAADRRAISPLGPRSG